MSASTATPNKPIPSQSDRELQAELLGIDPTVQPTSSRIGTWLTQLFVITVLIAIPLLYYFGYIGVTWLNRLGIILNFCAGFLLAPELLGLKRIISLENQIETILATLLGKFRKGGRGISNEFALILTISATAGIVTVSYLAFVNANASNTIALVILLNIIIDVALFFGAPIGIYLLYRLLLSVTHRLNEDNALRSIFIWWGIIFFIVGNLLQFLATF